MTTRNARATLAGLVLVTGLQLSGCVAYQAIVGFEATDLSTIEPGVDRSAVEDLLGDPIKVENSDAGVTAYYTYDQGYIRPVDKDPSLWWLALPAVLMADVLTMGTAGIATICPQVCQEGRLEVLYDPSNKLIEARERLPEQVGYCWTGKRRPHCGYVQSRRRPSTLPSVQRPFAEEAEK